MTATECGIPAHQANCRHLVTGVVHEKGRVRPLEQGEPGARDWQLMAALSTYRLLAQAQARYEALRAASAREFSSLSDEQKSAYVTAVEAFEDAETREHMKRWADDGETHRGEDSGEAG